MKVGLILPVAGVGSRFSSDVKKQFYIINNKPVLYYTLKNILKCYSFNKLVLGIDKGDKKLIDKIISDLNISIDVVYASGGKVRAETVFNCLQTISDDIEVVVIHDGVRPIVSQSVVKDVIEKSKSIGGAIPVIKVKDTVKVVKDSFVNKTIVRDNLYMAHTPQGFKTNLLKVALYEALKNNVDITDEASAMEYLSYKVGVVDSSPDNIKLTFKEDIKIIESLLKIYS